MSVPANWLDNLPAPVVASKAPRTEQRVALAKAMRGLTFEQRLYLKAWTQAGGNGRAARTILREAHIGLPEYWTTTRWNKLPAFIKAKEILATMMLDAVGASKPIILLRINKIAEYNAEEIDELHQGQVTGQKKMRDVGAALRANELLGREQKMWNDEKGSANEGPSLVVQIVSREDPRTVIDVTPNRVSVEPPVPE